MGAFEHVIALLSFVYALALTHLLSGIVALILSVRYHDSTLFGVCV